MTNQPTEEQPVLYELRARKRIPDRVFFALLATVLTAPFVVMALVDWLSGRGVGHMFESTCR